MAAANSFDDDHSIYSHSFCLQKKNRFYTCHAAKGFGLISIIYKYALTHAVYFIDCQDEDVFHFDHEAMTKAAMSVVIGLAELSVQEQKQFLRSLAQHDCGILLILIESDPKCLAEINNYFSMTPVSIDRLFYSFKKINELATEAGWPADEAACLYEQTEGWMFGCDLMLKQKDYAHAKAALFDYLHYKIEKEYDRDTYQLLLSMALITKVYIDIFNDFFKKCKVNIHQSARSLEGFLRIQANQVSILPILKEFMLQSAQLDEIQQLQSAWKTYLLDLTDKKAALRIAMEWNYTSTVERLAEEMDVLHDLTHEEQHMLSVYFHHHLYEVQAGMSFVMLAYEALEKNDLSLAHAYVYHAINAVNERGDEADIHLCVQIVRLLFELKEVHQASFFLKKQLNHQRLMQEKTFAFVMLYEKIILELQVGHRHRFLCLADQLLEIPAYLCHYRFAEISTMRLSVFLSKKLFAYVEKSEILSIIEQLKKIHAEQLFVDLAIYRLLELGSQDALFECSYIEESYFMNTGKRTLYQVSAALLMGLAVYRQNEISQSVRLITDAFHWLEEQGTEISACLNDELMSKCRDIYASSFIRSKNKSFLVAHCFKDFKVLVMPQNIEVKWRTHKAKECVAYLLSQNGESVTRDDLLNSLWSIDSMPKNEVASLHNLLSSIRKSLMPYHLQDLIQYKDHRYSINPSLYFSDESKIMLLIGIIDQKNTNLLQMRKNLFDLYTGEYMQCFDSEWCLEKRNYYERRIIEGLMRLANDSEEKKLYEEALNYYVKLHKIDCFNEEIIADIFRCYTALSDMQGMKNFYTYFVKQYKREMKSSPGSLIHEQYKKYSRQKGGYDERKTKKTN